MIRKISIDQLLPDMYVVDLHKRWLDHSLWQSKFKVRDEAHVWKLKEDGITEVSIDIDKGIDVPPTPMARINQIDQRLKSLAEIRATTPHPVSLGEERRRAGRLMQEASGTVSALMLSARAGQKVDAGYLEPVVSKMIASVLRNPDALVPLSRLKGMDSYANDHAVATAALIIAFGRHEGMPEPEIEKLALGTMVKDIGHSALDSRLTTKAGGLSQAEFSIVQSHVEEGLAVLDATSRLPETAVAVVLEHHERYNGCGYPCRMAGDEISVAGRMAAIVDTYDAMTSDRPYRAAMSPSHALRQLYEESGTQYDPALVAAFVKTVGIYPVGTLVLLDSGHLAMVVQANHENMLAPVVRVIYHTGRQQYVTTPVDVDLSRKIGNHYGQIVRAETFERWGISPLRWQPG